MRQFFVEEGERVGCYSAICYMKQVFAGSLQRELERGNESLGVIRPLNLLYEREREGERERERDRESEKERKDTHFIVHWLGAAPLFLFRDMN